MTQKKNLFQEFDTVSTNDWKIAIEKFLKGNTVASLDWDIGNGVIASPIHRLDDTTNQLIGSVIPSQNNNWHICEQIVVDTNTNYSQANQLILEVLNKGTNALIVDLEKLPTVNELKKLLQDVLLDLIPIHFQGLGIQKTPLTFLEHLSQIPQIHNCSVSCNFETSPQAVIIELVQYCNNNRLNISLINLHISDNQPETLSTILYSASLWIDKLKNEGLNLEQIVKHLRFEFSVGNHYFVELANIRAFKKLWLALLEAYNADKASMPLIHVHTLSNQNENQYWNMITATTQAMSAAIAGVDSIHVTPCNSSGLPDDFTRRIARNVQHLLQSESFLNRVVDPAAGSYYIENLTLNLAERAWQLFCSK